MPALPSRRRDRGARRSGSILSSTKPSAGEEPWRSGLFDPWYYRLQAGIDHEPLEAWQHYVDVGAARGLLPNPLTDVVGTGLSSDEVTAALLDGSARMFPVRPLLDDLALVERSPAAAAHPGGPVGFYLQHAHAGAPVPSLGTRSWDRFVKLREQQAKSLKIILATGIFDTEYYSLQTGCEFASDVAAVWHFLETGEALGLSPSPLYETSWYRGSTKRRGEAVRGAQVLAHFLRKGQVAGEAGPHFDALRHLAGHPHAREHPGGALGHFVAHADDSTLTVPPSDDGVAPMRYADLRDRLLAAAGEFGRHAQLVAQPPRQHADWWLAAAVPPEIDTDKPVAILADARDWHAQVPTTLASVLAQRHGAWTMQVAVDAGRDVPAGLLKACESDPRIELVPTSATSWAGRHQDLLAAVTTAWVAFWRPTETWSPYFLSGLLTAAGDDGAHAAVRLDVADSADAATVVGAESAGSERWWQAPRTFSGMLLRTDRLRAPGVLRPDQDDQQPWDVLLEYDLAGEHVPFIAVRQAGLSSVPSMTGLPSPHVHVVRHRHLIDWAEVEASLKHRRATKVSVVIVAEASWRTVHGAVDSVLADSSRDVEVIVVDNGARWSVSANLAALFAAEPRVRAVRLARSVPWTTAANAGLATSTGSAVLFLRPALRVPVGWRPPLVEALARTDVLGAQLLPLRRDGTIHSAGKVAAGPRLLPIDLLAGHPPHDLHAEADLRFPALPSDCLALRADVLVAARGFDPAFVDAWGDVDLCLRVGKLRSGSFVTIASVAAYRATTPGPEDSPTEADEVRFLDRWAGRLSELDTAGWQQAGLEVMNLELDPALPISQLRTMARPVLVRPVSTVSEGPAVGLPRLRWAIKNPAPAGRWGDKWGDTFFVDDLARALQHWGQEVVVDRREAHARPGVDHLDDVAVWLRGRTRGIVQPGATNVLWVISHPDLVQDDELRSGFDLVYAASIPWADQATRTSGVTVRPLLQATDPRRFTPHGPRLDGHGALFVGNTRMVQRPIVRDALAASVDLEIYGRGWDEFIDPAHVRGEYLDNADLPAAYRGAGVVLNDHWADMAQHSLFSNRLFDAVASGARVISDPVEGLQEVFGASVQAYTSIDELRELARPDSTRWPSPDQLVEQAAKIAANHSFTERARVMLADVLDSQGVEHGLRTSG